MTFESSATRASRLVWEKVAKARLAAATALSTSALEPSATSYIASSVAGLTTGVDFLSAGATQSPPTENCMRLTIVNLLASGHLERDGTSGKHPCTKAPVIEPAKRGPAGDAERHIRSG